MNDDSCDKQIVPCLYRWCRIVGWMWCLLCRLFLLVLIFMLVLVLVLMLMLMLMYSTREREGVNVKAPTGQRSVVSILAWPLSSYIPGILSPCLAVPLPDVATLPRRPTRDGANQTYVLPRNKSCCCLSVA